MGFGNSYFSRWIQVDGEGTNGFVMFIVHNNKQTNKPELSTYNSLLDFAIDLWSLVRKNTKSIMSRDTDITKSGRDTLGIKKGKKLNQVTNTVTPALVLIIPTSATGVMSNKKSRRRITVNSHTKTGHLFYNCTHSPADTDRAHGWCQKRLFVLLVFLLLLPLNHTAERFSIHPSVSHSNMSELGVISLLIASQNPSFAARIKSFCDYNEKIAIGRIGDRIGID